jgi:hypothetical protein
MIHYLNTDLELVSAEDLTSLAAAFEQQGLFPLHVDRREDGLWHAAFETNATYQQPETNIVVILLMIESLKEPLKSVWEACAVREFNIGYECGGEPWAFNQEISNTTLRRIAEVQAALRFTLYPPPRS